MTRATHGTGTRKIDADDQHDRSFQTAARPGRRNFLRGFALLALVVVGAFMAGSYWAQKTSREAVALAIPGFLWPTLPPLEPFVLRDAQGGVFDEAQLRGKWTLLFFGYTHCPDICPTTLAALKAVRQRLRNLPAFEERAQFVFVSVDAARDTPEILRAYINYFDPSFRAATASPEALHLLTRQVGVQVVKVSGDDPAEYWFDHSASILLIEPGASVVGEFKPPHTAPELAASIRNIVDFLGDDG